jgi:hypothetical protein
MSGCFQSTVQFPPLHYDHQPCDMATIARSSHHTHILKVELNADVQESDVPLEHVLLFPPFPPLPPTKLLNSFQCYSSSGVYRSKVGSAHEPFHQIITTPSQSFALPPANLNKDVTTYFASKRGGIIRVEDSWKIGQADTEWQEPVASLSN